MEKIKNKLQQLRCCIKLLLVCHIGCNVCSLQAQTMFTDITSEAGIDHQFVVFEGMFGGGACVFDLNNDGFEDLYLTSGMKDDALFLNQGNGTFKNIFENSGLEVTRHYVTQGVSGADVNRDGWVDLFVTTITSRDSVKTIPREKNLLFLNNGDATFTEATARYGLGNLYSFSTGVNFGDFNADGYPDAYVGNYFNEYEGELSTISDATIVGANQIAKGYLLLNNRGKKFKDVYGKYGMDHRGFGFGGVFTDFDNDGDQDLFINHDFGYKRTPDMLMENLYPKKEFRDIAEKLNMDLKINSMGTAVGDYNADGFLDYFITNIRSNYFMVNQGSGQSFNNMAKELGVSYVTISWGANFADFDQDGDVDLYVANGDLNPNCAPMGNFYFENKNGKFVESGRLKGVNNYGIGRGSVVFDLENDGDLDILVINQKPVLDYPVESKTILYRNDSTHGNWLKISLEGVHAESHGLGSRIELICQEKYMIREVDGGGSSHLSQNSTISHFGLGDSEMVDSVIVTWTGGKKQILTQQPANQFLNIVEEVEENTFPLFALQVGSGILLLILAYFLYKNIRKIRQKTNN